MRQSILFVAVIRNFVVVANVVCLAVERLAASFKPEMPRYRYAYATTTDGITDGRRWTSDPSWRSRSADLGSRHTSLCHSHRFG